MMAECGFCGTEFEQLDPPVDFCSNECGNLAREKREAEFQRGLDIAQMHPTQEEAEAYAEKVIEEGIAGIIASEPPTPPVKSSEPDTQSRPIVLPGYFHSLFPTIEIDFPWKYDDCGFNGWQDVQAYRIHPPYPQMTEAHIRESMPQLELAAHPLGAHLWLWTTKDFLRLALNLLFEFGWEHKQTFDWIKTNKDGTPTYGMGYWCRNAVEYLLFAIWRPRNRKGNPTGKCLNFSGARTSQPNYFQAEDRTLELEREAMGLPPLDVDSFSRENSSALFLPRSRHSAKPPEAYELISRLSPGPRLSIFQRQARDGFVCWGDQMPMKALPAPVIPDPDPEKVEAPACAEQS